ncbi:hypothetical protein IQ270_03760 [Microcoleus sp. LEGE 07076]|uniref:hypothetical protein n=1 Tax=Microcoleus sp. LEGE 07076 TaxID=915322 RepID=UPI0018811259|nr:hypothetical protein [Microcoleus sp. LEGE 07076]MBE9183862.1 hypothetical protein [Microcoleus sp. LEGE 07076]
MTIELALESPISMMNELCPLGDIELCFVHLFKENSVYRDYYLDAKKKGRFLILDNGIMELGYSMSSDDLITSTSELQPDLVTPPEILGDGDSTLKLTYAFAEAFERSKLYPSTKILGVAHGSSLQSWCKTFQELLQIPYISRIAVPYRIPFDVTQSTRNCSELEAFVVRRVDICNWIDEKYPNTEIHLFGLAHPSEVNYQAKHNFIKSIDTSLPIMAATRNIRYDVLDFGLYEKDRLNIQLPYSKKLIDCAERNITVLKQVLK